MSEIDAIGQYFAAAREAELKEQMFERRVRAIAREEIEAAKEPMPKVYVVKTTPINQEGGEANSSLRRNVGEDKSPPAVEAPAAGDCPHCDGTGLFRGGRAAVQMPKCPRCYGSGKADDVGPRNAVDADRKPAGMSLAQFLEEHQRVIRGWKAANGYVLDPDTTALARRLAEALNKIWLSGEPEAHEREVESALTEARKAGLIE